LVDLVELYDDARTCETLNLTIYLSVLCFRQCNTESVTPAVRCKWCTGSTLGWWHL